MPTSKSSSDSNRALLYQLCTPRTRALTKIPRALQRRILTQIESLGTVPRPHGAIKLAGEEAYRLRVGDYRIIYAIEDRQLLILIIDIGHRREIYRRN